MTYHNSSKGCLHNPGGGYYTWFGVTTGCCVAALVVVAGMALGGCGVAKCVKHFVNKGKSGQAKEVAVSSNQNVMGSDTLYLNATAMNQRTK